MRDFSRLFIEFNAKFDLVEDDFEDLLLVLFVEFVSIKRMILKGKSNIWNIYFNFSRHCFTFRPYQYTLTRLNIKHSIFILVQ